MAKQHDRNLFYINCQHSIGLVLIHDTHHDVNVEL